MVTGVAISVTGGREQSIPLQLKALATRGTYRRRYPAMAGPRSRWVLEFTGRRIKGE